MSVSIKEVMIKDIVSLPLNKTLLDAANEMITNSIGSIVILDTFSNPIGLITPFDVIEHMLDKRDLNEILLKSFEKPLIVVNENDKVTAAAIKFLKYNIHHLAVTNDNGDLVGVISTYDLAKVIVN